MVSLKIQEVLHTSGGLEQVTLRAQSGSALTVINEDTIYREKDSSGYDADELMIASYLGGITSATTSTSEMTVASSTASSGGGGGGGGSVKKIISKNGVEATSTMPLTEENNKIYAGETEVKLSPSDAVEIAQSETGATSIIETTLIEKNNIPFYLVKASKQVKIIRIIKANAVLDITINTEDGKIISVKKPWWSFAASGF